MAHVMEHILVRAAMALVCRSVGCPQQFTIPLACLPHSVTLPMNREQGAAKSNRSCRSKSPVAPQQRML